MNWKEGRRSLVTGVVSLGLALGSMVGAVNAAAQDSDTSFEFVDGQTLAWQDPWTLDKGSSTFDDGLGPIFLLADNGGVVMVTESEAPGSVEELRDAFLDAMTGESEGTFEIDRGAYDDLSYSLDLFTIAGMEFGLFSLFREETADSPKFLSMTMAPVEVFGETVTAAQEGILLNDTPLFDGVDAAGLQALVDENAGASGESQDDAGDEESTPEVEDNGDEETTPEAEEAGDEESTPEAEEESTPESDDEGGSGSKFGGNDDEESSTPEAEENPSPEAEESEGTESASAWTEPTTGLTVEWGGTWEEGSASTEESLQLSDSESGMVVSVSFFPVINQDWDAQAEANTETLTTLLGEQAELYPPVVSANGYIVAGESDGMVMAVEGMATSDPEVYALVTYILFGDGSDPSPAFEAANADITIDGNAPAEGWEDLFAGGFPVAWRAA